MGNRIGIRNTANIKLLRGGHAGDALPEDGAVAVQVTASRKKFPVYFNGVDSPIDYDAVADSAIPNGNRFYYMGYMDDSDGEPREALLLSEGSYEKTQLPGDAALFIGGTAEVRGTNLSIARIFGNAVVDILTNEGVIAEVVDEAHVTGGALSIGSVGDDAVLEVQDSRIAHVGGRARLRAKRSILQTLDTTGRLELDSCQVNGNLVLHDSTLYGGDNSLETVRGSGTMEVWGETTIGNIATIPGELQKITVYYDNAAQFSHRGVSKLHVKNAQRVEFIDQSDLSDTRMEFDSIANTKIMAKENTDLAVARASDYNEITKFGRDTTPARIKDWVIEGDFPEKTMNLSVGNNVEIEKLSFDDRLSPAIVGKRKLFLKGQVNDLELYGLLAPVTLSIDAGASVKDVGSLESTHRRAKLSIVLGKDVHLGRVEDTSGRIDIKGLSIADRTRRMLDGKKL